MPNPFAGLKSAGDEAVESAKAVNEKTRMIQGLKDQDAAMSVTAAPKAPSVTASVDKLNSGAKAKYGSGKGEQRIDTSDMTKKLLGSYKKGGKVKKTGIYKLHAKEQVLNAKTTAKVKAKGGMAAVLAGKK